MKGKQGNRRRTVSEFVEKPSENVCNGLGTTDTARILEQKTSRVAGIRDLRSL